MNQLPSPAEALHRYNTTIYVPLGKIAIADLAALQATDPGTLPEDRYSRAWQTFELSRAMHTQPKPDNGKPYLPTEQNRTRQTAQAEFTALSQSQEVPDLLRARSWVAAASIDVYHQPNSNNYRRRYLQAIQESARRLLAHSEHSEEAEHYLHVLTAAALLTEFSPAQAIMLPALPRQPWDMNALSKKGETLLVVSVADESRFGENFLPPSELGNGRWFGTYQGTPFATLQAYLDYPAGSQEVVTKDAPGTQLQNTALGCIAYFHATLPQTEAVLEEKREEVRSTNEEPSTSAEVTWYMSQSSYDLATIDERTLRIYRSNLELQLSKGELPMGEFYQLAWMQMDHAQILAEQSHAKQAEAQDLYIRASRVSRFDARAIESNAAKAEEEMAKLMAQARDLFDSAEATFGQCAAKVAGRFLGSELESLLDQAAVPVYKALYTTDDFGAITEAAHAYTLSGAALGPKILKAEAATNQLGQNDQILRLRAAALRTSLCLLLNGATDEAARHLVLPAGLRRGSTRGELSAIVFPINLAEERYEREHPVFVRLHDNSEITVRDRTIDIGMYLLMQKRNPIPFLSRLIQVERMRLSQPTYTRNRSAESLTLSISDAIDSAAESYN